MSSAKAEIKVNQKETGQNVKWQKRKENKNIIRSFLLQCFYMKTLILP